MNPIYPEAPNDSTLANTFSDFFKEKLEKINAQFSGHDVSEEIASPIPEDIIKYDAFPHITPDELKKVIMQPPTKSCALDPVPTFFA